jgi:phage terminase large subunit-like protein
MDNRIIRRVGRKLLLYKALPAPAAFHASPAKNRWIFGGNRSGKSESNIGFDLCSFALGVHPHRKTPPNAIIWAATLTWEMVGKLLWEEKIKDYIPANQIESMKWHLRDIPKEIRLVNGNVIEFRAYEQGREVFQGRSIDAFYGDEQAKSQSERIWQEVQARLVDRQGFSAQSMTPLIHQAWLENRIRNIPEDDAIFYADLNDNRKSRGGYIADMEIDHLIGDWPVEIQDTRIRGRFAAFEGAVYKSYRREVHVCDPFEIPADWPRYRAIDWGFNNPFVCLWLAKGPDNVWYVYREHYLAKALLSTHAEAILEASRGESYVATWADHDAQDRYEFGALGIPTEAAQKAVRLGIEAVQAAVKIQDNGKPRLQIFETCPKTAEEMAGYRWAEGTENRDAKDEPLKVNDHAMDALRYVIFAVDGGKYFFSAEDLA